MRVLLDENVECPHCGQPHADQPCPPKDWRDSYGWRIPALIVSAIILWSVAIQFGTGHLFRLAMVFGFGILLIVIKDLKRQEP